MAQREKRLVIFDIDGTLYRAELVSFPAYRQLAKEIGFPVPSEELMRTFFGETFPVIAGKLGLPEDEAIRARFIRRIEEVEYGFVERYGALFDGIYQQLERLHREGYLLALCSMGLQSYVERLMECTEIRKLITTYKFDDGVHGKAEMCARILTEVPHERAVFVGDRRQDWTAARENGLAFVGCTYGFVPGEVVGAPVVAERPELLYDRIKEAFSVETSQKI